MPAPATVLELVERFDRDKEAYLSPKYNEEDTRHEFINPLFEALGWDIGNKKGVSLAYREVLLEYSLKVGATTKAPDYLFRLDDKARRFFVEAKKPAEKLKDARKHAFQVRRYAWSAQLPLSILTDFEEFLVYDCRVEPGQNDNPRDALHLDFTYKQYVDEWDKIVGLFSREAVLAGSLEKFAQEQRAPKGARPVDRAFLDEINAWRKELARNIAIWNPELSQRELNYAVQMTLDRLIFLRIGEDRGIEPYGKLQELLKGGEVYRRLINQFRNADDRYNSGLFHFKEERGREGPDNLTTNIYIDDEPLKKILKGLYYPDSPYEFSVLPVEVLGNVYEQFLGKIITIGADRKVEVEEKPEVRKAGGVYYTPSYIVDYIVRYTVGKLLEGKTLKEAAKLRIVDPACGSGSFLIGAYQYLLDWHLSQYVANGPQKHKKELYQGAGGDWRLTTGERKRILLNNFYGVDIDAQAVEVTKLSLSLKMLEGETEQTLGFRLPGLQERALPDLSNNIKCGNSLIGPDFYDNQQATLLTEDEQYRVNVFDWAGQHGFREIMKAGGFDAVIGNPPYIFTRNQGIDELQKTYFYSHYKHQSTQLNTFGIFVEHSQRLLRRKGLLGFITPNNWLTIDTFAALRKFIVENTSEVKIVNILDRVFADADVDTAIVIFENGTPSSLTLAEMSLGQEVSSYVISPASIKPPAYIIQISLFRDTDTQHLVERIEANSQPLSNLCTVSTGLKVYQTGKGKPPQTDHEKDNRTFHASTPSDNTYGRYLDGVDVRRYHLNWSGEYLSYGEWIAEPRRSVPFSGERLLVRQIPSKPPYLVNGVFTDDPFYNDINSMVIFSPKEGISLKYILGMINSRLLSFWFQKTYDKLQRKIFPQFKVKELARFPMPIPSLTKPADKGRHDQMIEHVERILDLNKRLAAAKTGQERTVLQRQIEITDRQIDNLVYDLYELTPEERKIVEEATK